MNEMNKDFIFRAKIRTHKDYVPSCGLIERIDSSVG